MARLDGGSRRNVRCSLSVLWRRRFAACSGERSVNERSLQKVIRLRIIAKVIQTLLSLHEMAPPQFAAAAPARQAPQPQDRPSPVAKSHLFPWAGEQRATFRYHGTDERARGISRRSASFRPHELRNLQHTFVLLDGLCTIVCAVSLRLFPRETCAREGRRGTALPVSLHVS